MDLGYDVSSTRRLSKRFKVATGMAGVLLMSAAGWVGRKAKVLGVYTGEKAKTFMPREGVENVLAMPGAPGVLQVAGLDTSTHSIFLYTPSSEILSSGSVAKEGTVYGAKVDSWSSTAVITGSGKDILRGCLLSWPKSTFKDKLHEADMMHGPHPSVKRGTVSVVIEDGSSVKAYWYYHAGKSLRAYWFSAEDAATPSHFLVDIEKLPPDVIFNLKALHDADTDPSKVNLGIGAYRDDNGKPWVLGTVRKAEAMIAKDLSLNHEYLPITGNKKFAKLAAGLMFDKEVSSRLVSVQALSGTGGLRVAADFFAKNFPKAKVLLSNPTWGNHNSIFTEAGLEVSKYAYWDATGRRLAFDAMLADLRAAPSGSIVVLHACAHNPTGVDPTPDQWRAIAKVMAEKKHFPFFDSAYQGFASGDLERDAFSVKLFTELGFELMVAQSFAKNLGLYNERIGALHVLCATPAVAEAVESQLASVVRASYSNPPAQGSRIAELVLGTPALYEEWKQEMRMMSGRIKEMRKSLRTGLEKLGTPGNWEHITTQIGMFSYTGLTKEQCLAIRSKWHVYMLENGRISMAGINSKNVDYLTKAIDDVVRNVNFVAITSCQSGSTRNCICEKLEVQFYTARMLVIFTFAG
eukprot:g35879.t1